MRIVVICHYLPPNPGGIEHVVDNLASSYASLGWEVQVMGLSRRGQRPAREYEVASLRGCNPLERLGVPVPLLEPVSSYLRIRKSIRTADAVHVHGLPYPASLMALRCARLAGVPCVVTEHVGQIRFDNPVLAAIQAFALRWACRVARRGAKAIVVLNERVRSELQHRVAPMPVLKIANGIDTDRFRPPRPEERDALRRQWELTKPTVLFVGRNAPKKGLDLLVQALGDDPRHELVVVGDGADGLPPGEGRVRILGAIDQQTLAELYRAVDLLALPSEGEGLPLVVQEALV